MNQNSFELLSALAHDLRNPLTAVKGHAQILLRRARRHGDENDQLVGPLGQIEQAAIRMQEMLAEFVDVARVSAHQKLELTLQPTDLVAAVDSAINEASAANPDMRFTVRVNCAEVTGKWDKVRLQRTLRILLEELAANVPLDAELQAIIDRDGQDIARLDISAVTKGEPTTASQVEELGFEPSVPREADLKTEARLTFVGTIIERMGGRLTPLEPAGFSVRLPVIRDGTRPTAGSAQTTPRQP